MNQKQVKRIRADARAFGVDWREAVYADKHPIRVGVTPLCKGALWTGQSELDKNCGRAVYHRVKQNRQSQLRGKA